MLLHGIILYIKNTAYLFLLTFTLQVYNFPTWMHNFSRCYTVILSRAIQISAVVVLYCISDPSVTVNIAGFITD